MLLTLCDSCNPDVNTPLNAIHVHVYTCSLVHNKFRFMESKSFSRSINAVNSGTFLCSNSVASCNKNWVSSASIFMKTKLEIRMYVWISHHYRNHSLIMDVNILAKL